MKKILIKSKLSENLNTEPYLNKCNLQLVKMVKNIT